MALWQTTYNAIPRSFYEYSKSNQVDLYVHDWSGIFYVDKDSFFDKLDTFIERSWSMNQFQSWGPSDKSDIGVTYNLDKNIIVHIRFRLDLRGDINYFLIPFLAICRELDFLILDQNENLFEPQIDNFRESIENSSALKFVADPMKFIEDFSNGKIKPED
ncbi:hypothetical protein [Flavobacterium reichenbachii]|uniref:Uncharacterized protein n=1 Tax=Flavobacterium reichenbachii TaxID=362418 RepID=A0A085ZQ68_9FLAO|nr:hypothetical protein [Flavobacterium reichenbachii]KFF06582.1 hypothetical protein IW19_14165 [Flavobacterium reichenbachii]OXB18813.1 hypothetical protein B0A68_02025 [Flavobacterium reichenbachii]